MRMTRPLLEARQPVVSRVLYNALKHKQASHAYLFTGPKGTRMLEAALLYAQALVCPHRNPWPCERCEVCERIAHRQFTDLVILDGSQSTIKKEAVLALQEQFAKTALESYGKKIYVVNGAENATPEALNSLLKFLEEPSGNDTYAVLISEHPEALLETIVSRCQVLAFKPQSRQDLMDEAGPDGDPYEMHLLTQLVNNVEGMKELRANEEFKMALDHFGAFIDEYARAPYRGELYLQTQLLAKKKDGERTKDAAALDRLRLTYFFKIGMLFFKDMLFHDGTPSPVWKQRMNAILPTIDPMAAFHRFNDAQDKINANANLSLLIDSVLYHLKEVTHD
jgi:DNA polymerase III subunit delta'